MRDMNFQFAPPTMSSTSASVASADLDYVLSVKYEAAQFPNLIDALAAGGFNLLVRAGTLADHVLVFVKLSAKQFAVEAEADLVRNFEIGVTSKDSTDANRRRIIYWYLTADKAAGGLAIIDQFPQVEAVVNLQGAVSSKSLANDLQSPPLLTQLSFNYGVQVGLYFEYLKFYINWLGYLALIGTVLYLFNRKVLLLSYAFINLGWGLLFIVSWRRRQQTLVEGWGVQHCHVAEDHQQQLAAINSGKSPKKDNKSDASRFIKQIAFAPVALGFTAVLVAYQLTCFCIEIVLGEVYEGPFKLVLTLIPTVMIVVFVPVLLFVYNIFQEKWLKWENHTNAASRDKLAVVKTFVLNFLTLYVPLIITLFIYLPFAHLLEPELDVWRAYIDEHVPQNRFYYQYVLKLKKSNDFKINQNRLTNQFFYFVFTNQVIGLLTKYVVPLVVSKVKTVIASKNTVQPKDATSEKNYLQRVREVVSLPEYDVNADYRSLIAQYGYLILFGLVWPLAPLVLVVFNLITLRLDKAKVVSGKFVQPPIPKRVDLIAPWDYALFGLTWIGSIISPVVTVFYRHGAAPPKSLGQWTLDKALVNLESLVKLVLLMLASEHGFLIAYWALNKVVSYVGLSQDQDYVDQDIVLRRDYYSKNLKLLFRITDADHSDVWQLADPKSAIADGARIIQLNETAKKQAAERKKREAEEKHEKVVGVTLGATVGQSVATNRKARKELEKQLGPEDVIITNPDGSLSTFDKNAVHAQSEADKVVADIPAGPSSALTSADLAAAGSQSLADAKGNHIKSGISNTTGASGPASSHAKSTANDTSPASNTSIEVAKFSTEDPQGKTNSATQAVQQTYSDGSKTSVGQLIVKDVEGNPQRITTVVNEHPKSPESSKTLDPGSHAVHGNKKTVEENGQTTIVQHLELADKKIDSVTQVHPSSGEHAHDNDLSKTSPLKYGLFIESHSSKAKEIAQAVDNKTAGVRTELVNEEKKLKEKTSEVGNHLKAEFDKVEEKASLIRLGSPLKDLGRKKLLLKKFFKK